MYYSIGHNYDHMVRFLLDLGSVPNNTNLHGVTDSMLTRPDFGEAEYLLVSALVERGGPIQAHRISHIFRKNLQFILARDEESMSHELDLIPKEEAKVCQVVGFPEVVKILLRESETELRHALNSKWSLGHETFFEEESLFDFAFGWPRGVQMLLDWGLTPDGPVCPHTGEGLADISEDLSIFNGYYESAQILIRAGWKWDFWILSHLLSGRSKKLRSLFINDLVVQRQALWRLAEQFLPTDELPSLEEGSVLDANASCIYEALVAKGRKIDSRLVPAMGMSIYHIWTPGDSVEILEEAYQAGFRDINSCDLHHGTTPLICLLESGPSCESFAWFVSKGADPFQRLPQSSATATHFLSTRLTFTWICDGNISLHGIDQVLRHCGSFLLSPIKDECVCACSPDGCSIFAVALKLVFEALETQPAGNVRRGEGPPREIIQALIYMHKSTSDLEKSIIRIFTFDALGVKHTCCVDYSYLRAQDCKEVEDIREEEQPRLKFLEKLVAEFEAKHAELDIPILEFLEKHWHPRMIEFLSQRDKYDEEHHEECKRLGIYLEPEEDDIIDRVSLWIGPRLVEVED